MATSDVARAALASVVALLFAVDAWNVPLLAVLMFFSGAAGAFFHPAFSALKPRVVPDGEQQSSNASLAVLQTATRIGGPLLAGTVVGLLGPAVGFTVNAVSFVLSAVLLLRVRVRPERTPPAPLLDDLRDGLGAVTGRPWLWSGIAAATLYHLANGVLVVLLPIVVLDQLGGGRALGLVEASIGAGSLVGGLLAARVRPGRPLVAAWIVLTPTALGFLGLARPEGLPVVCLMLAVGHGALMVFGVWWETAIQREIPGHQFARVNAWDQMASFAVLPAGALLAGPLSEAYGIAHVVIGCVAVLLISATLPLAVRDTWRVRGEPRSTDHAEPAGMVT